MSPLPAPMGMAWGAGGECGTASYRHAARHPTGKWTGAMIFEDRTDAGRRLAERLQGFAERQDVVVLGIPRGGVVVAFAIGSSRSTVRK